MGTERQEGLCLICAGWDSNGGSPGDHSLLSFGFNLKQLLNQLSQQQKSNVESTLHTL